jgi:predicted DNA-binding transcriptional regulator YafY
VRFHVSVSEQFLGWILSLGNDIKIVEPADVVEKIKSMLRERWGIYTKK